MTKKRKIIISICMFIAMIFITTIMILWNVPSAKTDPEVLVPMIFEENNFENLELSFTGQSTGPREDPYMEPYLRVYLTNPNDLYTSELSKDGYGILEGFLDQYINYYLPGDKVYAVEYKKNSVSYNQIATKFKVILPELDLEIQCIYIPTEQEYLFNSDLDVQINADKTSFSNDQSSKTPTVSDSLTISSTQKD